LAPKKAREQAKDCLAFLFLLVGSKQLIIKTKMEYKEKINTSLSLIHYALEISFLTNFKTTKSKLKLKTTTY